MPVVLLIAGLVILVAVILVAAGRGGELPAERTDYAPLDLGPASATDVALLRPPTNAWGYNMQATDEAMAHIAQSIRERDIRIVALEQLVTDLTREPAPPPLISPYIGARRRALPEGADPVQPVTAPQALAPPASLTPLAAQTAPAPQAPAAPQTPEAAAGPPPETAHPAAPTWSAETAWSRESASPAEPGLPADATRPDIPVWTGWAGGSAEPEAEPEAEAPPPPGEDRGQVGPPERSHG